MAIKKDEKTLEEYQEQERGQYIDNLVRAGVLKPFEQCDWPLTKLKNAYQEILDQSSNIHTYA